MIDEREGEGERGRERQREAEREREREPLSYSKVHLWLESFLFSTSL